MIFAFYDAGRKNRSLEMAEELVIAALGAQGEQKAVEQQLSEWADG